MQLSNLIRGVHRGVEDFIAQRIKASGLSVEQYRILEALHQSDGRSMGNLAAVVFVDSPTLTKIVDRMVTSSLVFRAPDAHDRRKVLVYKAQKGAQLFRGLASIEAELHAHLEEELGRAALDQLTRMLGALLASDAPAETPATEPPAAATPAPQPAAEPTGAESLGAAK